MDAIASRAVRSPPGVRQPRVRPEDILDAATDLFAEFGYSDAVTNDLMEKLGIGKGTSTGTTRASGTSSWPRSTGS